MNNIFVKMFICVKINIKNFNVNNIVKIIVVIDELNKYKPQPTSRSDLFLNVINENQSLNNVNLTWISELTSILENYLGDDINE